MPKAEPDSSADLTQTAGPAPSPSSAVKPSLPVPEQIGRYRVVRPLGSGGMGTVVLAYDETLAREVALKIITGRAGPEETGRFLREARAAAALGHPHIATVYDLGEHDGRLFIAMEHVAGQTLSRLIASGPLPPERALLLGRQIASALAAAHNRGVVHRDLKPGNVIVTPGGVAKLLDFGLAKVRALGDDAVKLTTSGAIMGTPAYMSPEQAQGRDVGPATDVFSFGALFYEMVAGESPFARDSLIETLMAVLQHRVDVIPAPTSLHPDLAAIVLRCLSKAPEERFLDGAALEAALLTVAAPTGEAAAAPPPRPDALSEVRTNLPASLTPLLGRDEALAELSAVLDEARLVTLLGPGGAGKTRLAIELGRSRLERHEGGVFFVDLAPLTSPALVASATAEAIGVKEVAGRPIVESLTAALRTQATLLILDNCEHVTDAGAALVESLLAACPHVRVVATSREALSVAGERRWLIPPLPVPSAEDRISVTSAKEHAAVALFMARGAAVAPGFALDEDNVQAVVDICRRLDGLPLAIELAAARLSLLSVDQIRSRLDQRFRLLTGNTRGVLPRQQTLRALVEWSHDLLDQDERRVFRTLGAFAGSFSLEAVEAVAGAEGGGGPDVLDAMARLVSKSLVVKDERSGAARFRMLETIRELAAEKLAAAPEHDEVRDRHMRFYVAFATTAGPRLMGPEQPVWMRRIREEMDNLRAAMPRALAEGQPSLDAVNALAWYLQNRFAHEAIELFQAVLALPAAQGPTASRADALFGYGSTEWNRGDYDSAEKLLRECVEIRRGLSDPVQLAIALATLASVLGCRGDFDEGWQVGEEAVAIGRATSHPFVSMRSMASLTDILFSTRDLERYLPLAAETCQLCRALAMPEAVGYGCFWLGYAKAWTGHLDEAAALFEEGLTTFRPLADAYGLACNLTGLAFLDVKRGDVDRAARRAAIAAALPGAEGIKLQPPHAGALAEVRASLLEGAGKEALAAADAEVADLSLERLMALAA